MLYQRVLCTTVPQRIRHKDPYAAAESERLQECATQSAANHDRTGCRRKGPLYAGQSVSVINNDRTLWLPATIVRAADHGSIPPSAPLTSPNPSIFLKDHNDDVALNNEFKKFSKCLRWTHLRAFFT